MSCSDVLDLIEPIAAGDLGADEAVRAHLRSCVTCAAALASAQRLEAALKGMEIPPAPATFSATVMQRIRRDRWQSEQNVDRLFNLAIVAAVLLMVGGIVALLNIDGMLAISGSTLVWLREGMRASFSRLRRPWRPTWPRPACWPPRSGCGGGLNVSAFGGRRSAVGSRQSAVSRSAVRKVFPIADRRPRRPPAADPRLADRRPAR